MGIVFPWASRILFVIPGLDINVYTYGTFLALNFLVCWIFAEMDIRRKKLTVDSATTILIALTFGTFFSKFAMVLVNGSFAYSDILTAGLSFQGGVVGASAGLLLYIWYSKCRVAPVVDSFTSILPVGHAIGKLGCFFSADGCYGMETDVPWGMSFPNGSLPTRKFVHPAPIYEFVMSGLIFIYLWRRRLTLKREFDNAVRMLILLSGSRVLVEFVREHPKSDYYDIGLSIYQLWALCGCVAGIIICIILNVFKIFGEPADVKELRLAAEAGKNAEKKKVQ